MQLSPRLFWVGAHDKLPFPELVEGSSFLFMKVKGEVQPFDRLRVSGDG